MWNEIQKNISFSPRRGHAVIEYKDHVYVLGGEQCKGGNGNVCEQDENDMPAVWMLRVRIRIWRSRIEMS